MINGNQTVGEIAAVSLEAVGVFEKHGIDYCCGGRQLLRDACLDRGLDLAAVREDLDSAIEKHDSPAMDWTKAPLRELIRHILSTHHEFLKLELPRLGERLQKVVNAHGDKDPDRLAGLSRVFGELHTELDQHMHKEEMILFPAIERCESAVAARQPVPPLPFGTLGNPIAVMEKEHENAGIALQGIKDFTSNYQLPEYACVTCRALYGGLGKLEADLHQHIHLENNILFPKAIELERSHR